MPRERQKERERERGVGVGRGGREGERRKWFLSGFWLSQMVDPNTDNIIIIHFIIHF